MSFSDEPVSGDPSTQHLIKSSVLAWTSPGEKYLRLAGRSLAEVDAGTSPNFDLCVLG
jgi:hypothetical protein